MPDRILYTASAYSGGVLRGLLRIFLATGWVLSFLTQLYALYALSLGMTATQRVIRWQPYRLWVARIQQALREFESRGIEQLS